MIWVGKEVFREQRQMLRIFVFQAGYIDFVEHDDDVDGHDAFISKGYMEGA